jgi:hypothetical protein
MAILRLFLGYLRLEAGVPTLPPRIETSPAGELKQRYVDYRPPDPLLTFLENL